MMLYQTKEQVVELTSEECEKQLKLLTKQYNLDKPISECFLEVWPNLDDIVNTLLWLEERIDYIKMCDQLDSIRHKKPEEV